MNKFNGYELLWLSLIITCFLSFSFMMWYFHAQNKMYVEHGYDQCMVVGLQYPIWKKECAE
jgi:hypothetical protein